jgi:hypothetical protein
MASGEGGDGSGGAVLAVVMRGHPSEPSHTDYLSVWEASLAYPPERCEVQTFQEGDEYKGKGARLGLMGVPLEREIEYCDDYWQCDSVGPTNRQIYRTEALCKAHCWRQRGGEDHYHLNAGDYFPPTAGLCYQPWVPTVYICSQKSSIW